VLNVEHPEKPFEIATTIHAYPHRKEYKGKNWVELAEKLFEKAKKRNGYFHLWFHSKEIFKYKQVENLYKLLEFIKKNK